jgi:hypothetical protein
MNIEHMHTINYQFEFHVNKGARGARAPIPRICRLEFLPPPILPSLFESPVVIF